MSIESEVTRTVRTLLDDKAEALASVGLQLVFRGIVPTSPASRTTEARISVYENGQWIDSLEFFVVRDGVTAVTQTEVESWLGEQLDRLIADQAWNGGWEEA